MAMRVSTTRRGFTLIELMVVIGLILLLVALAVPAFSFISGSRSVDAASNIVSAMLARARSEAVSRQGYVGVLFYREAASDRSAMALVTGGGPSETAGDYYNGWTYGNDVNGNAITYKVGDQVIHLDSSINMSGNEDKRLVGVFTCTTGHASTLATEPPNVSATGTPLPSPYWNQQTGGALTYLSDTDVELLPNGIGCQIVNDSSVTGNGGDRYLRTDVVMFGPDGKLVAIPWTIAQGTAVSNLIGTANPIPNLSSVKLESGLGVALYDRQVFANSGYNDEDVTFAVSAAGASADDTNEENWLDTNATLLTINRYDGTAARTDLP